MTPKEQYEARRARRKAMREASEVLENERKIGEIDGEEFIDRIATALERIADRLEEIES